MSRGIAWRTCSAGALALVLSCASGGGSTADSPTSAAPCDGLLQGKASMPVVARTLPAKGEYFTEPDFGSRMIRITDVAKDFGSRVAVPLYSTMPAWNADESLLLLYVTMPERGHALFDGHTYRFVRMLDIAPADVEQVYWDPKDPDVLWYLYDWEQSGQSLRQLIRYHVRAGRKEVVHRFANCDRPYGDQINGGGDPQYNSWDNKLWGLRCRRGYPLGDAFSFRLDTGRESARVTMRDVTPVACPSGQCLWMPSEKASALLDPDTLAVTRRLALDGGEHGDLGLDRTGEDFFASSQYDGANVGSVVVEFLRSGRILPLISPRSGYPYPPSGTHISAVAFDAPGWLAVSIVGRATGGLLDSEVLLADVNSGAVCRLGHHRSLGSDGPNGYWAEPHVTISPHATRAVFASDWNGGAAVDTYVVETPAYVRAAQISR